MTSYLRSWLTGTTLSEVKLDRPTTSEIIVSPPLEEEEEGSDTATEGDNDNPPAFPSLLSIQRMKPSAPRILLSDSELMPPPPLPHLAQRTPGVNPSRPNQASPSSLGVLATTERPAKKSATVSLAPGHSPLDWANLKSSGQDLRVRLNSHLKVGPRTYSVT